MSKLEANIKSINEKLQQLIKKYASLKKENEHLKTELNILKEKEVEYKYSLHELEQKVSILKVSSGEMSEPDKKDFEKRINQYLKEIDKCITLLSD